MNYKKFNIKEFEKNLKRNLKNKITLTNANLIKYLIMGTFFIGGTALYADNVVIDKGKVYAGSSGGGTGSVALNPGNNGNTSMSNLVKEQATAIGSNTQADNQSVAIGADTVARGYSSIAIGSDDNSAYLDKITNYDYEKYFKELYKSLSNNYGYPNSTNNYSESAKAYSPTYANGKGAIAIGSRSLAYGDGSTAMGTLAFALGQGSTAIGTKTRSEGIGSIALGNETNVFSNNSVSVGNHTQALNEGGMSYGYKAYSGGLGSIAIGSNVYANTEMKYDGTLTANGKSYKIHRTGDLDNSAESNGLLNYDLNGVAKIAYKDDERLISGGYYAWEGDARTYYEKLEKIVTNDGAIVPVKETKNDVAGIIKQSGKNAIVIGSSSVANGNNSIAFGRGAFSRANNTMAIGSYSYALQDNALSIGLSSRALAENSIALGVGTGVESTGYGSIALGTGSVNYGRASILLGNLSRLWKEGENSILIGRQSELVSSNSLIFGNDVKIGDSVDKGNNIAVGNNVVINPKITNSMAIGKGARIGNALASNGSYVNYNKSITDKNGEKIDKALALGTNASVIKEEGTKKTGNSAIAIGTDSVASLENSVALGVESKTDYTYEDLSKDAWHSKGAIAIPTSGKTGVISVGSKSKERRIVNVASGALDTDAVNVAQLKTIEERFEKDIEELSNGGGLQYVSVEKDKGDAGTLYKEVQKQQNYEYYTLLKKQRLELEARQKIEKETFSQEGIKKIDDKLKELEAISGIKDKASELNNISISETDNYDKVLEKITNAYETDKVKTVTTAKKEHNYLNDGATGKDSFAFGYDSESKGDYAIAFGHTSKAAANESIAIGHNSKAEKVNAVAIGSNSQANRDLANHSPYSPVSGTIISKGTNVAEFSIGSSNITRVLTNVEAGQNDTDAVNVKQLKTLSDNKIMLTADAGKTTDKTLGTKDINFGIKGTNGEIKTNASGNDVTISLDPTLKAKINDAASTSYVDNKVNSLSSTLNVTADKSTTASVNLKDQKLAINGTENEVETKAENQKVTVSLSKSFKDKVDGKLDKTAFDAEKVNFAKTDLSNITNSGKKVITDLLDVKAEDNSGVTVKLDDANNGTDGKAKVFKVGLNKDKIKEIAGTTNLAVEYSKVDASNINKIAYINKLNEGVNILNPTGALVKDSDLTSEALTAKIQKGNIESTDLNVIGGENKVFGKNVTLELNKTLKDKINESASTSYVDNKVNSLSSTLNITADKSTTGSVNLKEQKLAINGTENEVETKAENQKVTVSLSKSFKDKVDGKLDKTAFDAEKANFANTNLSNITNDGKKVITDLVDVKADATNSKNPIIVTLDSTNNGTDGKSKVFNVGIDENKLKEMVGTTNLTNELNSSKETVKEGTGIKVSEATNANGAKEFTVALTDEVNNKINNAADKDLSNLTEKGKTEIKDLSKDAVKVALDKADGALKLNTEEKDGNKTYTLGLDEAKVKEITGTTNLATEYSKVDASNINKEAYINKLNEGVNIQNPSGALVKDSDLTSEALTNKIQKGSIVSSDLKVTGGENKVFGENVTIELNKDLKDKINNAADKDLSNLTEKGKTEIKNLSKDAVKVAIDSQSDSALKLNTVEENGNKTYTLSLDKDKLKEMTGTTNIGKGKVEKDDKNTVTGDTVYNAVKDSKTKVDLKNGESILEIEKTESDDTKSNEYKLGINKEKLQENVNLTYKANGKDEKTVSLKDGLNFTSNDLKIESKENGEVSFKISDETMKKLQGVGVEPKDQTGPASKDGLNGKDLTSKINALRNGEAGSTVYTDNDGNRLAKANDGKYYNPSDLDDKGNPKLDAKPIEKPILSTVNPDGTTTNPVGMGNVASSLGLDGKDAVTEDKAKEAINGKDGLLGMNGANLNKVATNKDLQALAQAGVDFVGNDGKTHNTLGSKLSIIGKEDVSSFDGYSTDNVATKVEDGKVLIGIKEKPRFKVLSLGEEGKTIDFVPDAENDKLTLSNSGKEVTLNGIKDAKLTNDSKEAVNGSQFKDLADKVGLNTKDGKFENPSINKLKDSDGEYESDSIVSGINNTINTVNKGINFGDGKTKGNHLLGSTLNIKAADIDDTYKGENLKTKYENGNILIGLNENSKFKTVTIGNIKLEDKNDTLSLGGKRISDVAEGVNDTDAVNVSQLKKLADNSDKKISMALNESNAGVASAMAMSAIPQVNTDTNQNMIGVGASHYRGVQAIALGYSRTNNAKDIIYKFQGSMNSLGHFGIAAGMGYTFGENKKYSENDAEKIKKLQDEVNQLKEALKSKENLQNQIDELRKMIEAK